MNIDTPINELITDLTANLWTSKERQFYGRVFRTEIDGKIKPVYYLAGEAVDPLKDDRKDAQCFVDVMPQRKMIKDVIEAECRLCFMTNLKGLYPSMSRIESIEQVMADVIHALCLSQFEFIQLVSGYDSFKDYSWFEDALSDLQDHHLFRFDLKVIYTNS